MDGKPVCRTVPSGATYQGKQGLTYSAGVYAQNVGAAGLCLHVLTIAPGQRAIAHRHEAHETAIYVVSGAAEMWFGEDLSDHLACRAGDFVYIPAGVPHLPYNPSHTEPCTAIIARTDPNEQESVVLMPELEIHARH
ncbi:MAG TPA: cupin domain-containing protein [Armatimonadota bacterium]|jgi:uncharacterized RmlC-like cupin family protein